MQLSERDLLADIRQRFFSPMVNRSPRTIGVELELIPVVHETHARVHAGSKQSGTVAVLRALAAKNSWSEQSYSDEDPPSWKLAGGSCISFEPGGQIEVSTAPSSSANSLIESTTELCELLTTEMAESGIDLLAFGVDPYNGIANVPLQLQRERYRDMTRYFERLGPSGIQMMRQTAALQINLERGEDPRARWRLLTALSPFVLALFANSTRYAGRDTKWASYRSYFWRTLDPSRTGVIATDGDVAQAYTDFALDAFAMRSDAGTGRYRSFRDWMSADEIDQDEWNFHLTTLFPEVRAKEHFELRSADTIEVRDLAAPVVFVTGLVYDEESAARATRLLPQPNLHLLELAGRRGVADTQIRSITARLAALALEGATRMGETYVSAKHIEIARAYFDRKLSLD